MLFKELQLDIIFQFGEFKDFCVIYFIFFIKVYYFLGAFDIVWLRFWLNGFQFGFLFGLRVVWVLEEVEFRGLCENIFISLQGFKQFILVLYLLLVIYYRYYRFWGYLIILFFRKLELGFQISFFNCSLFKIVIWRGWSWLGLGDSSFFLFFLLEVLWELFVVLIVIYFYCGFFVFVGF